MVGRAVHCTDQGEAQMRQSPLAQGVGIDFVISRTDDCLYPLDY